MKKEYYQPQIKMLAATDEPLLTGSIEVDPGEEGDQEEAESKPYKWHSLWDEE